MAPVCLLQSCVLFDIQGEVTVAPLVSQQEIVPLHLIDNSLKAVLQLPDGESTFKNLCLDNKSCAFVSHTAQSTACHAFLITRRALTLHLYWSGL